MQDPTLGRMKANPRYPLGPWGVSHVTNGNLRTARYWLG